MAAIIPVLCAAALVVFVFSVAFSWMCEIDWTG
jgi:hypothetical protein